jgi:peptidoglycan/LPS O-acetylase OafA/YrhL
VISGYLITGILLEALQSGQFSLAHFYERRARRILPALFFVMMCCVPAAWLILLPERFFEFANSVNAVLIFASNVLFWLESGYFETASELQPLLHTWSLAVEEQFYLAFPILLALLWRFRRSAIFWTLSAIGLLSFGLAEWGVHRHASATFYLIHTRAWELLIGALLALHMSHASRTISKTAGNILSGLGLLLIAFSVFAFDHETPFPGFLALFPTLGAALVIYAARPNNAVGWFLSSRAFVSIGLISYSAYLWHQPLLALLRSQLSFDVETFHLAIAVGMSFALAWFTWLFVERPFRRRERISLRQLFALLAPVALSLTALTSIALTHRDAATDLWLSTKSSQVNEVRDQLSVYHITTAHWGTVDNGTIDGDQTFSKCRFNARLLDEKTAERLVSCAEDYGPGVLVLGDSHAIDLFGMLASRFDAPFLVGLTQGSCRPHGSNASCPFEALLDFVEENPDAIAQVIFEQAGFYLLRQKDGTSGSRQMFESLPLTAQVSSVQPDDARIQRNLDYLGSLSRHVDVIWFGPRAAPHISSISLYRHGCSFPYIYRPGQLETYQALDSRILELVRDRQGMRFVSQNDAVRYSPPQDFTFCGMRFWSDGDHLSALGEETFGRRLPDGLLD